MASFGHVAVGLAAGAYLAGEGPPGPARRRRLALACAGMIALSLLPDLDVIAFRFGIPYEAPFGHRGASHSLAAALGIGGLVGLWRPRIGLWAALVVASHGLLDTLTTGGRGVALLWPLVDDRYFAPWRPIPVSPIGLRMLSARGLAVVTAEVVIFAPLWIYALWRMLRGGARGEESGA
ncbi:MAG: metal-dependent hydrolase [Nannocystaceae bacterium]